MPDCEIVMLFAVSRPNLKHSITTNTPAQSANISIKIKIDAPYLSGWKKKASLFTGILIVTATALPSVVCSKNRAKTG
jgi:hypothetical protein